MTDINIYDLCKKYFGSKKATKYKVIPNLILIKNTERAQKVEENLFLT